MVIFSAFLCINHTRQMYSHMCIFSSLNTQLENASLYLPFKRASKIQHLYLLTHLVQTFAMDQFYCLCKKDHMSLINWLPQIPMHLLLQKSWHLAKTGYTHHQVSVGSALLFSTTWNSVCFYVVQEKNKGIFESQSHHNPNQISLLPHGFLV